MNPWNLEGCTWTIKRTSKQCHRNENFVPVGRGTLIRQVGEIVDGVIDRLALLEMKYEARKRQLADFRLVRRHCVKSCNCYFPLLHGTLFHVNDKPWLGSQQNSDKYFVQTKCTWRTVWILLTSEDMFPMATTKRTMYSVALTTRYWSTLLDRSHCPRQFTSKVCFEIATKSNQGGNNGRKDDNTFWCNKPKQRPLHSLRVHPEPLFYENLKGCESGKFTKIWLKRERA